MRQIHWAGDITALIVCLAVLGIYHVYLYRKIRREPLTTSIGVTEELRKEWVRIVMTERRDVLAVQTLRNWVMASSFLASTAILICLGVLNAAFRMGTLADVSHSLNLLGSRHEMVWMVKLMILSVAFLSAFFNFILAIRYFNHASFGLGLPDCADCLGSHDFIAGIVQRGSLHYTVGMRGYYLAIPLTFWLFGPLWMLAATLVLLLAVYQLDRRA